MTTADFSSSDVDALRTPPPDVAGVRLLTAMPAGEPFAIAPAVREADGVPVEVVVATAPLDPDTRQRIRVECVELDTILASVDPTIVLPLLDHGVDAFGRPYLIVPRPSPTLEEMVAAEGPMAVEQAVAVARAYATGLRILTTRGVIGPPGGLRRTDTGAAVLATPMPPTLVDLGAAGRHEPPEVARGAEWTPEAQTYACASALWTLLFGRPWLSGESAERFRSDVPPAVVTVLRSALAAEPRDRPGSPDVFVAVLARAHTQGSAASDRPAAPAVPEPRRLGGYLLDAKIGQGTTGEVWSGRCPDDGRPVAVKLLRSALSEDPRVRARFQREHAMLCGLRHPNLVAVHDLVTDGDELGIVMDLVVGADLRQLTAAARLPVPEAAHLLAQTAHGLAALHAAGLVHRDVKPANVLVTERDGVRVALLSDFGLARAVDGAASTQLIGTPAYLAPELVAGRAPGPAADIYALGITAYELITGRPPFQASTVEALLLAHLEGAPARPADVGEQGWDLLAACLDKDPSTRPDAAEVARRWEHLSGAGASASASAEGAAEPPASNETFGTALADRPLLRREPDPPRRRRRWPLILAVAATLVVGLGAGVLLAVLDRGRAADNQAATSRQYPVAASLSQEGATIATLSWGPQAAALPGFQGYVVVDVSGDRARPVSTALPGDVTSYRVEDLRAGRRSCYLVVAVGVTVAAPNPLPPPTCVTPPSGDAGR
jgi:serine/threonine-protein kinase